MYLLDTNIVSYWMKGDKQVINKIQSYPPVDLALSAITYAEILYGIAKSPVKKKERTKKIKEIAAILKILPFEENAAKYYALIRTTLEKRGTIISERDLQIASIAKANRLKLITHNFKEFNRIEGLIVEDWAR